MGWYSSYKLYLSRAIEDFDYKKVDEWADNQDKYFSINYQRCQYQDNLVVYVTIKYGRSEIDRLVRMLKDEYGVSCHTTIVSTDNNEWSDWREYYEEDE